MRIGSGAAVVAAFAAVLLSACAGGPGGQCDGGTPTTPASPTAPPTDSPDPTGSPRPTPTPPDPSPELPTLPPSPPGSPPIKPPPSERSVPLTLTGTVIAGVEAGCQLLQTGGTEYLLLGKPAEELRAGATVTVRGQVRTDVMSYCQQGTPFEVTEVLSDRTTD